MLTLRKNRNSPSILRLNVLIIPLMGISFLGHTQAGVSIDILDYQGTQNSTTDYHVYDGSLGLNAKFEYSGTRDNGSWGIDYRSIEECQKAEQTQLTDDNGNTTCSGGFKQFDTGYKSDWLDDPKTSLEIGPDGAGIHGMSGESTGLSWNINSTYVIQFYGAVYWGKDNQDTRIITYMGQPKLMDEPSLIKSSLKETGLRNIVGYEENTLEHALQLYFFPANRDDYVLDKCTAIVDAGDTTKILDEKNFQYLPVANAMMLSFKLSDLKKGDIDKITVVPTCHFKNRSGSLVVGMISPESVSSISETVNVEETLRNNEKIIDNIITITKDHYIDNDRPQLTNLFARTLNSGSLKITGEVVRQPNANVKGIDSAKNLAYMIGTSPSENQVPTDWHTTKDYGYPINFSVGDHTFDITIPKGRIASYDKLWIKVAADKNKESTESIPQMIDISLSNNATLSILPPSIPFCIGLDGFSETPVNMTLDLNQPANLRDIEVEFSGLNDIKAKSKDSKISITALHPSGKDGLKSVFYYDLNKVLSSGSSSLIKLDLGNISLPQGQYEILFPLLSEPQGFNVTLKSSVMGSIASSKPGASLRLDATPVNFPFSQCNMR